MALDRSASGENDLDLLVRRADAGRFADILYRLGFKEARLPSAQQMPGVLDYYGYDRDTGKLIHVHAHYQLILGDDMTKNYCLPIERPFLESAIQHELFKIPAPEFELIVFVIRMILKHSTWDAMLARQGNLPAAARRELDYLYSRVNPAKMFDILQRHLPYIDATLFERCLQSLRPGCPIWTRVKLGQRLQSVLVAQSRRPRLPDTSLKLWHRVTRAIRRRVGWHSRRQHMEIGGAIIAVVGGDGAGKSTAIEELYSWLSKDFDTLRVHMGKPAWSRTTIAVRGILKLGYLLRLFPFTTSSDTFNALDADAPGFPGYPWLLREVCTARDRYLTYVTARRFATNGGVAICDRFPLPQVKLMDWAQVERVTQAKRPSGLVRLLIMLEMRYYRPIRPPELLIVLRVDPEVAVQRKTTEDPASVRARSQEIWRLDWGQTCAHVIDAGRSRAEVLSELKSLIWSEL